MKLGHEKGIERYTVLNEFLESEESLDVTAEIYATTHKIIQPYPEAAHKYENNQTAAH